MNGDPDLLTRPYSALARRPWRGLILLGSTAVFSVALMIYGGAWAVSNRVDASTLAAGGLARATPGEAAPGGTGNAGATWWEDGVLLLCPFH